MPEKRSVDSSYWRTNLRYVTGLLVLWFVVSYGCGILFVDVLDKFRIGGFKFGFWMAQQGSIYSFVVIVFIYVQLMNRLERKYTIERRNAE
jgi:putative solute:sodium symporter small subunit